MQMYHKSENPYFSYICFLNMDISLIIALICLITCMYIFGIGMEGSLSQNFDLGLSFSFMLYGRRHFEKKYKNHKSYLFFIIK